MASAPHSDDALFDDFLETNGHQMTTTRWEYSYNKKQCPECGGIHSEDARTCTVCGWKPV
ncbi:HVO_0416 family zinc finger protein [Natronocalculus amylovorans]|uniref:Small CPxCG-related zinc finger protein n=1 Tax=Natronocalculus amylovorans TaxID=2917812 RepID=A0AAE3FU48_9EURY|nr:HVO_0416 family zinc finger protein [Natronocalculus amylovorans]MCL9815642.1 hypothetical protein [Natronocalculus amylovorans]NUE01844.1 hypothetical protein [Halorubraceae archaeon YAN]